MSALFLSRFLSRPFQVASIIPSSPVLIRKVVSKLDLSGPRVVVEFGPGEGCHTRELARRLLPGSRLLLFELDPELAAHLVKQFAGDPRIEVLNADAQRLPDELAARGIRFCDYVVSGIPFSCIEPARKRALLDKVFEALAPAPHSALVVYQVTNELRQHAGRFPRNESEHCLYNIPPMFVTTYFRSPLNGCGPESTAN